jgi:putative component of toxin-antitoxin plasmid stabilization module
VVDARSHITLFNDERFQHCNLLPGQRRFRYDHIVGRRLIGTFSGVIDGHSLDCGHSAPFGGIDFPRRGESAGAVLDLLRSAGARAKAAGVREMRVRARPGYYGPNETAVEFAMLNLGATIEACELSLGIETWRYRSLAEYEAALRSAARNRLRHGLRAAMAFGPAKGPSEWAECYELLDETRRRHGANLRISFDYVMHLRAVFQGRISMYRLTRGGELAGAALLYRIARDWNYVVAWGDDLRHRNYKVMNVMADQLVRAAIAQRVSVVDAGVSSIAGVPDDGLIQFKRSVGATTGLRLYFALPLG